MKLRFLFALLLAFGLSMVSVASADIIGDFDNADGTGADTFGGVSGGGWSGGWIVAKSNATATATLKSSGTGYIPFDADNDKYLQLVTTYGGTGKGCVFRNYMGATGDVNFTQDYTIAFSFRADDLTNFTSSADNISFYTDPATAGTSKNYGTSYDSTYQIRVKAVDTVDSSHNLEWYFQDGNKAGGANNPVSAYTGIDIAQGTIYNFVVTMHPATYTYDVVLTSGTSTYSSKTDFPNGLGWRNTVNGQYLSFADQEGNSGSMTVAIDNIRIAQVPEPSTLVLLASALIGLLIRRRK